VGYFDRTPVAPAIPAPSSLQLWNDGRGGLILAWRRPLGGCDGYVLLCGATPETLAELTRLPASATRWPVPAAADPWFAVACLRGTSVGEPSAAVSSADSGRWTVDGTGPHRRSSPVVRLELAPDDLQAVPVCACCAPPRPLAPDDGALACPATGELYAALATGALARTAELPFGLCRCCEARQPLMRSDAAIVCMARPEQRYSADGGRYTPLPPASAAPAPLVDPDAIDAALRANSALLGRNGVFVHETQRSDR